jgi:hypothetical protein
LTNASARSATAPTAVDGEGVTAVGDLFDLGDRLVLSLALERCVCDRPRDRLHQSHARRRHVVGLIQLRLVVEGIRPAVLELVQGESDGTAPVKGVSKPGLAARNAEIGSGSTPRNGPGSIATVAADKPRSAMICASSPPVE